MDGRGSVVENGGFVSRHSKCAGKRCQRVVIVVNEQEMGFAGQASVLCKALVGGSGQSWRRALLFWNRLTRGPGMASLSFGQIDSRCWAAAVVAGHRNVAVMIADHLLHDRQSEPRSLQLRRVIRCEQ